MPGFFSQLLDLFFPPRCTFCRRFLKRGERDICAVCENKLDVLQEDTIGESFAFCAAPLRYGEDVRLAVHRFKFRGHSEYAKCFGRLMAKKVKERLTNKYDIITWVPVSAKRKKTRGYDQAMLLAYAVANELGDVALDILVKRTDVPAQSGISDAQQRKDNVYGAFDVRDAELVAGKRVLLIDDIITTSATLNECARVLKENGASEVYCAALASAVSGKKAEV